MERKKIKQEKHLDFPFYNGIPRSLYGVQWFTILGFSTLGFILLSSLHFTFLPAILNMAFMVLSLPLLSFLGYRIATGSDWQVIFKRLHLKDVGVILLCILLAFTLSFFSTSIITFFGGSISQNPGVIRNAGGHAWISFIMGRIEDIFQLFGEEFLAIMPFLGLLQLAFKKLKITRKKAIVFALVLSSLLFGLLHLPTYSWNWLQCIIVVGGSRVFLTLPYLKTKSIWASYATHFLYDTILFSLSFFF